MNRRFWRNLITIQVNIQVKSFYKNKQTNNNKGWITGNCRLVPGTFLFFGDGGGMRAMRFLCTRWWNASMWLGRKSARRLGLALGFFSPPIRVSWRSLPTSFACWFHIFFQYWFPFRLFHEVDPCWCQFSIVFPYVAFDFQFRFTSMWYARASELAPWFLLMFWLILKRIAFWPSRNIQSFQVGRCLKKYVVTAQTNLLAEKKMNNLRRTDQSDRDRKSVV